MRARQFLMLAAMLVIMGERWDLDQSGLFDTCTSVVRGGFDCKSNDTVYRRVYVIGERIPWLICSGMADCADYQERFTIPIPNVPVKAITKEEAEKADKGLTERGSQ